MPEPQELVEQPLQEKPNWHSWLAGWVGLLGTVFLLGATLNSLFRWLPYRTPWDLGGFLLSGVLAWGCYLTTLSRAASARIQRRLFLGLLLPILWAGLLPIVMHALGFVE